MNDDDEDDSAERIIQNLQRKATSLFSKEDRSIIFEAVNQVHHIIQRTTYLLKLYYLYEVEHKLARRINVGKVLIDACVHSVLNKSFTAQVTENNLEGNSPEIYELVSKFYKIHFEPLVFETKLSLSHILHYSQNKLLTNYKNNNDTHYEKYVTRVTLYSLCLHRGHNQLHKIPHRIRQDAYFVRRHLLYGEPLVDDFGLNIPVLRTLCYTM